MRHPHGETAIVHPRIEGGRDAYGNPVVSWGDDIPLEHCAVAPAMERDPLDPHRYKIVDGYTVYADFDAPVKALDEITVRGERLYVDGEPNRWRNPFTGDEPGCEIRLRRING